MASGSYVIGLNEVSIGIPMPRVVAEALMRVVGHRRAEELCQTARLLGPDEALAVGLIDRVVPMKEVVPSAVEWCRGLTELPSHALAQTRRTIRTDLVEIVERSREHDVEILTREWYRPEVQGPLRELAEKLAKR
jgi:enoyl-CoA hydratase/carnithine racemase